MGHPITIILHLVALLLAAIALWSMRHELSEKAASRFEWALPPLLALIVAAVLLLLTVARLVTSDLMNRSSGKFGVLGAAAVFLAAYLAGRLIAVLAYSAPKSIHRDMVSGRKPAALFLNRTNTVCRPAES